MTIFLLLAGTYIFLIQAPAQHKFHKCALGDGYDTVHSPQRSGDIQSHPGGSRNFFTVYHPSTVSARRC